MPTNSGLNNRNLKGASLLSLDDPSF